MSPNIKDKYEAEDKELADPLVPQAAPRKYTLLYPVIIIYAYWHIGALYGLYLAITSAKQQTIFFNVLVYILGGLGVTAGAHRLWSHRSYKAKLPLQILLMVFHTMVCQQSALSWARDHRHYFILMSLLVFILPVLIPVVFWQESFTCAHHVHLLNLVFGNHIVFAINSVAHTFGNKPYDSSISPTQNLSLTFFSLGECYHNYHHVFPFDYRTSELGNNYFNFTTQFIDFFAWIGWAYDLKHATDDVIAKRAGRTGDGTDLWGRAKEASKSK